MKKFLLWLPLSLFEDLKALAEDKHTSVAAVMREAAERMIREWREQS